MKPKISVVMAVYNEANFLCDAIESILNQTFRDFEFIIVDDASSDSTLEILNRYAENDIRIRIICNESNLGLAGALNKAINLAKGEWIARMDGDDISLLNRFEKQITFLEQNKDIDVLSTGLKCITPEGEVVALRQIPEKHNTLIWRTPLASPAYHGTVMMRASKLREVGGYKINYLLEDVELWSRLIQTARFASIPDYLYLYRRTHEEYNNVFSVRMQSTYEIAQSFVSTIVGYSVSMREYMNLRLSDALHANKSLTEAEIDQTTTLLFNLYYAMKSRGLFIEGELSDVNKELTRQITNIYSHSADYKKLITNAQLDIINFEDLAWIYWRKIKMPRLLRWIGFCLLHPNLALAAIKKKFSN
jgi:glycosyltransferase involved in cell wall biosynthesis